MNNNKEFEDLCAHWGIAAEYRDAKGHTQRPPDPTRLALLRALGVAIADATDGDAAREALNGALDEEWARVLPPVIVAYEDAPALTLPLALPDTDDWPLRWVLRREDGTTTDGSIDIRTLEVTERRALRGRPWVLRQVSLPLPDRIGYHRLELFSETRAIPFATTSVILAPRRCFLPEGVAGEKRSWGLVTQLYAVRSARNWGIGDFTDLTRLVELTADAGGGVLALSPLHALFPGQPERCNPYDPSSRVFLNFLHIDVEAVPELAECEDLQIRIAGDDFQALLRAFRAAPLVDYTAVTKAKLSILERLYRHFREHHLAQDTERARAFGAFCDAEGEPLRRFALFEALCEHFADAEGEAQDFREWPEPYRQADSEQVTEFAAQNEARIAFFQWLQWHAHQQLQGVGRRSLELRLALGLCTDLAVGVAPDGADAWSAPDGCLQGVHIGAPPDDFSPKGQDWGVLAWHPLRLREVAYAPFAAALRANMREAGALRIDHLMGLMRLFLIPEGRSPQAGAYLTYPQDDLLGILALESVRNQCLIIGEDIGRVPEELRATLASLGIFSTRLLYTERAEDGSFLPPDRFEPQALVAASTQDLPTLAGFWRGTDLEQRRSLGLCVAEGEYQERLLKRNNDRARLFLALDRQGLLPDHEGADPIAFPELTPRHICAIHVYLARTPCRLLLIQTADLLGQTDQVNLPGSGDAYPNWRQRQPLELESWGDEPKIDDLLAAVRSVRGVSMRPEPVLDETETQGAVAAVIPRATYRLQLHAGFGFAAAAELVPYLAELGVSHCYFSPYLEARPGSTHGYDVIAHHRLNPELGTFEDYERLCDALAAHGMGQILDMVPNHVGVMGHDNHWWLDVLENGTASQYAAYFDIDWAPLREELRGKVLLPLLGDHYGNILDNGELVLAFGGGAFRVEYYEHHFPIDPREYPRILAPGLERLRERLAPEDEDLVAFESLITAFGNLPPRWRLDPEALTERRRDKEHHKQRLAKLCAHNADLAWYLGECLREFNGSEDYPADYGRLHALLEAQAYRLAHWRVAADEINYRRFFDINDLAALRMENPETFEATHALVLGLIAEGRLDGLRIDHPDGLYDPAQYFRWIQQRAAAGRDHLPEGERHRRTETAHADAGHWEARGTDAGRRDLGRTDPVRRESGRKEPSRKEQGRRERTERSERGETGDRCALYLLVEKILVGDEQLPTDWPVHGTTGYEFAALVDALLVDPAGEAAMDQCYRDFAGPVRPLPDEIYAAKRAVMRNLLSSELHVLASELSRIAESDPHTRDYTLDSLSDALAEVVACFPVYRTYIARDGVSSNDKNQILKAVSQARRRSEAPDLSVFGFVQDVLLTDIAEGKPETYRERVLGLAMKFQQYTGPVTAKGVEDTAFYRYHRLTSLNEVGADPERFGISVEAFHRANQRRREAWPHAMLAGSTHDNKRSEDMRARLDVLSELPDEWRGHVERWTRLNRRFRREADGATLPDANTEYLLYQTLLGAWPLELGADALLGEDPERAALDALRERIQAYMAKAVKEAKVHTAWTNENTEYEAALASFIEAMLDLERNHAFFEDFLPFHRRVAHLGLFNGLSATLLRLTAPGVPDIYQGSELWGFHLVDPDNRRPVDFARRKSLLAGLQEPTSWGEDRSSVARGVVAHLADGRAKLYLLRRALELRRADPALFADGDYVPLSVTGTHAERLCAYARCLEGRAVIAVAPRLLAPLVPRQDDPAAALPDPFADGGWDTTFLAVPVPTLEDRLAGSRLQAQRARDPEPGDAPYLLPAADLLRGFPVGLLTSEG